MAQYNFSSPFGAFSDAIQQELLRREMQKRQDLLDSLKQKQIESEMADRVSGRQLQERQQNLMEQQRADALAQRAQEHQDALDAVAPPQPGMVGNVPQAFALPMDNTGDTSGLTVQAPTAGGSIYQENRRKAAERLAEEQARLDRASQDKADQRDFMAQQNDLTRAQQLMIAHLSKSNSEESRALANQLKALQIQGLQDKQDTQRADRQKAEQSAQSDRQTVYGLAQELLNDPSLNTSVGPLDALMGRVGLTGEGVRDFNAKKERLKSLLSLENRSKLKGQGAVSDFEGRMLEAAATSLNSSGSEAAFKQELQRIMQATKTAGGGALPPGVTVTRVK